MSNIDDIFKKGLDGSGMEYSDASWAGMEQMLNTKKVGFFARYQLLLGLGSLLLIGSVALFYLNTKETTANTPAVVTDSGAENAAEVGTNENLANNSNSSISEDRLNKTRDEVYKPTIVSENEVSNLSSADAKPLAESGASGIGIATVSGFSKSTIKEPMDDRSETDKPTVTGNGGDVNVGDNDRFTSVPIEMNANNDLSKGELPISVKSEVLTKPDFGRLIFAESISVSEFEQTQNANYPSEFAFLQNLKHKKFSFYMSPYAGYVMYAKSVNSPQFLTDEEANLGKSETQKTYNYGLNIGIKKGNWTLSSGVGFLSLKESTFYTQSTREYEYTTAPRISNTEYTTTPRGTRVALVSMQNIDSTLVESRGQVCEGCEVSFNYISVPLSLQYNFGKSRLRYFADAGVTASFLQNTDGNYALPQEVQVDSLSATTTSIVSLASSEEISKMLLQANAAVGVKFWLTPRWNLWTSYGYGMGLNSMLGSYEQKPTIQNLRVGVEFKLR